MDGDLLDRGQDRLQWGNPAEVAASARTRRGAPGRYDERGAGPVEGARAGEPGAAASERDPAQGFRLFCPGGARPPVQAMIAFIDEHRAVHGVELICRVLPIAAPLPRWAGISGRCWCDLKQHQLANRTFADVVALD